MKRSDLRSILTSAKRQIQQLRLQQSSFGLHTPPHITTQIEDLGEFVDAAQIVLEMEIEEELSPEAIRALKPSAQAAHITL